MRGARCMKIILNHAKLLWAKFKNQNIELKMKRSHFNTSQAQPAESWAGYWKSDVLLKKGQRLELRSQNTLKVILCLTFNRPRSRATGLKTFPVSIYCMCTDTQSCPASFIRSASLKGLKLNISFKLTKYLHLLKRGLIWFSQVRSKSASAFFSIKMHKDQGQ